jgi:hypothetical protein
MNLKKLKLKRENINAIYLIFSLFASFLIFPSFFEYTLFPIQSNKDYIWNSLDPSWAITLNYINNNDFIWGKDIVFTYGPLSFFSTRIGWGCNKYIFLLYDLFCFLNFALIFYYSLLNNKNKLLTLISIFIVVSVVPTYLGGANALVLFLFLLFWLVRNIEEYKLINYIFQIILICLLFYIKLNTGLISIVLFTLTFIYLFFSKKDNRIRLIILFLIPFILLFLLSFLLNVQLLDYLLSGIEIVSGYNEIMYLNDSTFMFDSISLLIIFLSLLILIFNLFRQKEKQQLLKNFTYFSLFSIAIFILYKQAFVRADNGHIMEFFKYCVLLILCTKVFYDFKWLSPKSIIVSVIIFLPFYVCFKNYGWTIFDFKDNLEKSVYINQYNSFTETSGMKLHPNNNQMPESVKQKIMNNSVDVFPWSIYMLLENKLNYLPRPVIQSYTVYTKHLEELNFNFYNSSKAPKYVLYDYASLDYRYPLFDEARVNLVLMKNYDALEMFTFNERKIILFERKEKVLPIKFTFIKEYAILTDSPIVPKKDVFYELEFYSTSKGKIFSILSHAPEIKFSIKKNNNGTNEYRTSKSLLKTGFFSDYHLNSTDDYYNYCKNLLNEENKIKYYTFYPVNSEHYKEKIKVKEYKITQ